MSDQESDWTEEHQSKLNDIKKQLSLGAQIYQSKRKPDTLDYDGGRAGLITSMNAAIEFLELFHIPSGDIKPLNRLQAALVDLGKGRFAEFFPKKKTRGASLNYEDHLFQALAVAVMDLFMEDDDIDENRAAELAMKELQRNGFQISYNTRGQDTAGTLVNWRKRLDSNTQKARHDLVIEQLHKFPNSNRQKAKHLASQIDRIVRPTKYVKKSREDY